MDVKRRAIKALCAVLCLACLGGCSAQDTASEEKANIFTYQASPELSANSASSAKKETSSKSAGQGGTKVKTPVKNGRNSSSVKTALKEKTYSIKSVESMVKLSGRAYIHQSAAALDWDCAAVEFNFQGAGRVAVTFSAVGSGTAYLKAYVAGKEIKTGKIELTGENQKTVTLTEGLTNAVHKVRILRVSGNEPPYVNVVSVTTANSLVAPPAVRDKRMLFIGDNMFTGSGVLLKDEAFGKPLDVFNRSTIQQSIYCDSSLSLAYQTAQALEAEYEIVAKRDTGFGISQTQGDELNLTALYAMRSRRERAGEYNFPGQVDYVVVGSARCDYEQSLHAIQKKSITDIICKQRDFIFRMKGQNPACKIIWCYGLYGEDDHYVTCMQQMIELCGGHENGIYTLKLPASGRGEYPSAAEHESACEMLCQFIQSLP